MEVNPVKKIFTPAGDKGSRISYVCAVNRFRHPEMQEYNNPEIDDWFSGPRLKTMEGFFFVSRLRFREEYYNPAIRKGTAFWKVRLSVPVRKSIRQRHGLVGGIRFEKPEDLPGGEESQPVQIPGR